MNTITDRDKAIAIGIAVMVVDAYLKAQNNFKESEHPRDDDGKFTDGTGTSSDKTDKDLNLDKNPREMSFKEFFGTEYNDVKGQDAVNLLLEKQEGYVKSAFRRNDIGDIDLVWGNNLAGLCHIIKRRKETNINIEEFLQDLTDVINLGNLTMNNGKIYIWKDKKKIVISADFNGKDVRFIITAFSQRKE